MPETLDENGLRRSTYFLLSMPIAPPQSIVPAPVDRHVAGNRIYAPHFGISYRKRRKVTLKATQVNTILCQSALAFEALLKELVEPEQAAPGDTGLLF